MIIPNVKRCVFETLAFIFMIRILLLSSILMFTYEYNSFFPGANVLWSKLNTLLRIKLPQEKNRLKNYYILATDFRRHVSNLYYCLLLHVVNSWCVMVIIEKIDSKNQVQILDDICRKDLWLLTVPVVTLLKESRQCCCPVG